MSDKIQKSYRQSRNIYDDVLTRSTWWSRLYMDIHLVEPPVHGHLLGRSG